MGDAGGGHVARAQAERHAHILFFEVEVAARGQHHAVFAQDKGAVEHSKGAQGATHFRTQHVALVFRIALEGVEAKRPRLLHHFVGVANHEQRPHRPAFPALHADGDRQVDERLQNLGLHAFGAQEAEPHVFLVRAHVDQQDGIWLAHRTRREQSHDHVALGIQPTRDAADQG